MSKVLSSPHPVAVRRIAHDWTQAELAIRAEIPRSTLSAIEAGRLVTSVTTALALARALECSVEELFAIDQSSRHPTEPVWAWKPIHEPARYWEATIDGSRLLFPVESLALNPIPHDGVWSAGVGRTKTPLLGDTTLVVACCDPAAGLLATEYARESGFRMIVLQRGGNAALDLLKRGLVHVAGIHRSTPQATERNAESAGSGYSLLRLAEWEEGLAAAPTKRAVSLSALAKNCNRWALREPGSAARECLDELLGARSPEGLIVLGHMAVADAIRAGWADSGICIRLAAQEVGLDFFPVRTESLDLCFAESNARDPRIQALIRVLRTDSQRRLISELPGYDARHTGEIRKI